MNYLKKKIEDAGIDVYDTPKVVGTYLVANKILYGSMLFLCYKRQPLFRFCKRFGVEKMILDKFPRVYTRGKNYYNKKVTSLSESKIYNKTITFIGLNPKKTINTVFEASLMYKLCLPLSFPLLMYVSMHPYRKLESQLDRKLDHNLEKK